MTQDSPKTLTRRDSLITLAVTATVLMIPRAALAQDTSQLLMGSDVCSLVPETTEGPYYVADRMIRSDIREDRDGQPLLMRMQVVDPRCAPIEGARVDIWHCDAQGTYSSFGDGRGETFLRGTQMADARGVVPQSSEGLQQKLQIDASATERALKLGFSEKFSHSRRTHKISLAWAHGYWAPPREVELVSGKDFVPDMLTKSLPTEPHQKYVGDMCLRPGPGLGAGA